MRKVTVTQLLKHAKQYFDAVEQGETLEVSRHGKPIAILSPASTSASDYWKTRRPLPIKLKGISASQMILQEREEGW